MSGWRKRQIESKDHRNSYWMAIRAMRSEYYKDQEGKYTPSVRPPIHEWAEKKYGFKMEIGIDSGYTENYTVIDPKKFMLFQIKYWR